MTWFTSHSFIENDNYLKYNFNRYKIMIKNKRSFEEALDIGMSINSAPQGIGEYKEKTMHVVLKNYYENDCDKQEVKIDGFVADICNEYGIIEIQTRNFNAMRKKLDCFLQNYEVTIVYPLFSNKYINWIDSNNEKDYMRKSPRHDSLYKAFKELYKIKMYLDNPNLHLMFVFLDVVELKYMDGWSKDGKKGSTSLNKVPTRINDEIYIDNYKDFNKYMNITKEEFTVKDFAKDNNCTINNASLAINIFKYLKLIKMVGKNGRAFLYRKEENL